MKNSTRLAAVAMSGAAMLFVLAGCSSSEPSSTSSSDDGSAAGATGTVAYSPTSVQIPVLVQVGDAVKSLATDDGLGFNQIDGAFDPTTQIQQVTQAIDNGSVQSAWVVPVAGPATAPLIEHAQEKGVPILVQTTPTDVGLDGAQPGVVFQGPNFASFGEALGKEVTSCIDDKGLKDAKAILLTGPDTLPGTGDTKAAALDAIGDSVDIVAEAQVADVAAAQTQTQQLLGANPDANVVISLLDEGALGAVNAYKTAGATADCVILGGGGPDALAAQKAGDITTIVAWDFVGAVPEGWAALQKIIADPKAEGDLLDIPFTITK